MKEPIANILMEHCLHWLGHMGRMRPERMPKPLLFGELEKNMPCHGNKEEVARQNFTDLQATGIKDGWYKLSQERTLLYLWN